ncbi:putative Myb/SANT-like domain-containing protein [Helianthus annuus]|nr:putative Myb/SANT-like domain-containing protein [Helianthus annuus]
MSKLEPTGKKEQIKWTESMDNIFIQSMIAQQDRGNRINGSFTSQAYNNMIEELNTKLQIELTKKHMKNRLKTLKEHFSQWYDMFRGTSLSGFSWNSETQLIEAEDEVWDKLIDSKPDAAALKTKKVSNFNEMLQLFAKDRASGAQAETAKERNARLKENDSVNIETVPEVDDFCAANDVVLESQCNTDDDIQGLPPTSSRAKKCKSRKRKVEQQDEDLTSMIMNGVGSVANAILEGNKILERAYHREYTGEEIYNALEPLGMDSHEIRRALNFLATNQAKARMLFSCPPLIRLGLLRDMMGSGN